MCNRQPDAIGIVDEAGLTGKVRNLTPDQDGQRGLVSALMLPDADLNKWESVFSPPFDKFRSDAPTETKLHITDAFASGDEKWIAATEEARQEIFDLVRRHNLFVIYTARDATVARRTHEQLEAISSKAKESKPPHISVSERLSGTRHVSECYQGVVCLVDILAESFDLQRIELYSDEIDQKVLDDMEASADRLRNISKRETVMKAYDNILKKPVFGKLTVSMDAPGVDVTRVGPLKKLGKTSSLVFAADVIANALLYQLTSLPEGSSLNTMESVKGWVLEDRVYAPPDESYDIYSKI